MKMFWTLVCLLCLMALPVSAREAEQAPDAASPQARADADRRIDRLKAEFLDLELGMFIHFNMATYKNAEWVAGYHSPADFDPGVETIDTDAWAEAAKSAGMTYAVLTTKHVAGFCLWDSEHTTYDVMHPDSGYQKDLVAQFVKSFTERGMKVGLYYCWRHPGFDDKYKVLPPECDPAEHNLAEQIAFQKKQIAELVEKYPACFYIWNDALDDKIMSSAEAKAWVRGLGPDLIASSNWWDWGKKGTPFLDIAVKELRMLPEDNPHAAETCFKLEQKWFWKEGFRSGNGKGWAERIDKTLARRSNVLLNVGPDRDGKIIPSSVKTLAEIGKARQPRP